MNNNKFPEYKVIVVGDSSVGKTSIIMRFQHDSFSDHQPTVGASFITKKIDAPFGPVMLNLWDTAGQEKYRSLVPMYSRGASIAIIVFDVSSSNSFDNLKRWITEVRQDAPENCKIVIAGNKEDMEFAIEKEEILSWATENGHKVIFVSALTGSGIKELFQYVGSQIPESTTRPTVVNTDPNQENRGNCSC